MKRVWVSNNNKSGKHEGKAGECDAFAQYSSRGKEREKMYALSQWANFWISNALLLRPANPSPPPPRVPQRKVHTQNTAFSAPNTFLLSVAHSHTGTPVSAHITGRPSINKHKSNEKQHNTLQLGHFKHVQEELLTLSQQQPRDRANSCLPYPTELCCRQETQGLKLPSKSQVWKAQQETVHPTERIQDRPNKKESK